MAKREVASFKATGLHTYADVFSATLEGSMSQAINVVIDKDGIIEPRRGFRQNSNVIGSAGSDYSAINHTRLSGQNDAMVYRTSGGGRMITYSPTGSNLTTILPDTKPSEAVTARILSSGSDVLITNNRKVIRFNGAVGGTNNIYYAGLPEIGIDKLVLASDSTTSVNFLTGIASPGPYNSVKYKVVVARENSDGNILLGPPSQLEFISNDAGAGNNRTVDIVVQSNGELASGDVIQVYRSDVVTGVLIPDVFYLVQEYYIGGSPPSKGSTITIRDKSKGSLGTPLYTNATQDGPTQANYEPPRCLDIARFNQYVFYANIYDKAITTFRLSGNPPLPGTYTYKFTINGTDYVSGTDYTIGATLEETCRNLVRVVNQTDSEIQAYYDSSPDDELQGVIRLQELYPGSLGSLPNSIIVTDSNTGGFTGIMVDKITSQSKKRTNRLFYSKYDLDNAVPLLNYFDVGELSNNIIRIVPLRTALMIFTTNGLYKLTGIFENQFQISLVDSTILLEAPESLAIVDNIIYGLFDTGILAVNETGSKLVSRQIENLIKEIQSKTDGYYATSARGISYESEKKYILNVPNPVTYDAGDQKNDLQIVYNVQTQTFTTWDRAGVATGLVHIGDGKLHFFNEDGTTTKERKDRTYTDYADEDTDITINSVNSLVLTLASVPSTLEVDDIITQGSTYAKVVAISGNDVTVSGGIWNDTDPASALKHIPVTMEFNPITAGSPTINKQWPEVNILMNSPFENAYMYFASHNSQSFASASDDTGTPLGGFGLNPWGQGPWGGNSILDSYRTLVPRDKQRSPYQKFKITQNTGYNKFEYAGISLIYRPIGSRLRR